MPARSNALSELTRFWLETRHGYLIRESVPVPVPRNLSDIDLLAVSPKSSPLTLPGGDRLGPRLIVETKDEHDFDASGRDFGRQLLNDITLLGNDRCIPEKTKNVKFVMLRQEHFRVAEVVFGTDDFDRLFVTHAIDTAVRADHLAYLKERRIHWLTVDELLEDLVQWYRTVERPAGLRNSLVGDLFHLLFGYCGVQLAVT